MASLVDHFLDWLAEQKFLDLHVADGNNSRIALRLLQMFDRHPPHLLHSRARN